MTSKNKHKPKLKEEENEPFKEGSIVEVSSDEEGFRGAWYVAKIINLPPFSKNKRKGKAFVEYQTLLTEEDHTPLTEDVDISLIRPLPSPQPINNSNNQSFEPYDVVDAFYCDGWWKGVVTKVNVLNKDDCSSKRYAVIFDDPPDQMEFSSSDLRLHFDWINGKWVQPGKQKRMKGLKFSKGMTVEVSRSEECLHDFWFPATVLKEVGFNSFLVKYNDSKIVGFKNLCPETVDSFHIRPPPPKSKVKSFDLLEKVDAFCGFDWRPGFITKILTEDRYIVQLKGDKNERKFRRFEIRPNMRFLNGRWVSGSEDKSTSSYSYERSDATHNFKNPEIALQFGISDAAKHLNQRKFQCSNSRMNLEEQFTSDAISDSKRVKQTECNSEATLSCPSKILKMEDSANLSNLSVCHKIPFPIEMREQEASMIDGTVARCSNRVVLGAQMSAESESSFVGKNVEINQLEAAVDDETMVSTVERERLPNALVKSQLEKAGANDTSKQAYTEDIVEVEHTEEETDLTVIAADGTRDKVPTTYQLPDEDTYLQNEGDKNQQQKAKELNTAGDNVTVMDFESCQTKEVEFPGVTVQGTAGCEDTTKRDFVEDIFEVADAAKEMDCSVILVEGTRSTSPSTSYQLPDVDFQSEGNTIRQHKGEEYNQDGGCDTETGFKACAAKEVELHGITTVESADASGQMKVIVSPADYMAKETNVEIAETSWCSNDGQSLLLCSKGNSLGNPANQLNDANERQLESAMQSPAVNAPLNSQPADMAAAETFCCISRDGEPELLGFKGCSPCTPVNQMNDASESQLKTVMQSPVDNVPINCQQGDVSMAETLCCSSSDGQPPSFCSKGHSPSSPVNQLNDDRESQSEPVRQSPLENLRANSQLLENPETPFMKSSPIWEKVESLEVFRFMPQKPHFLPLVKFKEACREGYALGSMVNFATLVEKVTNLQIDDHRDVISGYLDTLADLEMHGFDVKVVVNRLNKLLMIKDKMVQLQDRSKENETQLTKCSTERTKLKEEIDAIDEKIKMLKEKQALNISAKETNDSKIATLELDASVINKNVLRTEQELQSLASASW